MTRRFDFIKARASPGNSPGEPPGSRVRTTTGTSERSTPPSGTTTATSTPVVAEPFAGWAGTSPARDASTFADRRSRCPSAVLEGLRLEEKDVLVEELG